MVAYFCFFSRWPCCWSRDWLRFARPSLFGYPLQEISNHLSVFASDFRFLSAGKRASRSYKTKIRNQLLLFPDFLRRERDSCFGKRLRRLRTPARVFSSSLMQKKRKPFSFLFLRRERDSNPRYLSVRRFSRPVQSTTLPPLHELFFNKNVVSSCLMVQRYIKKIYGAREMLIFFVFFVFFLILVVFLCVISSLSVVVDVVFVHLSALVGWCCAVLCFAGKC